MPSPFPGMDPYIEGQEWEDFHATMCTVIREALVPQVRPRYEVRVERRVYLERHPANGDRLLIRPDVAVVEQASWRASPGGNVAGAAATAVKPIEVTLPKPQREHEYFLTIRDRAGREVVTVLELLSPGNKRLGSDSRREYLEKRENVLLSSAHLVELDLLRGGEPPPTLEPAPRADYHACVCRKERNPKADLYCWSLRQAFPLIPIPLAGEDPDVLLDLQAVFTTVYDRAGYDYSLDYQSAIVPPLSEDDAAWAERVLRGKTEENTGRPVEGASATHDNGGDADGISPA